MYLIQRCGFINTYVPPPLNEPNPKTVPNHPLVSSKLQLWVCQMGAKVGRSERPPPGEGPGRDQELLLSLLSSCWLMAMDADR